MPCISVAGLYPSIAILALLVAIFLLVIYLLACEVSPVHVQNPIIQAWT